ncbi:MAG: prolipoprotein diacylglyceryl transferase, partial [Myxococcota bacterium]|nr:prolipoprotein diacylglyceryl transferase [Myxococcota bacterium]
MELREYWIHNLDPNAFWIGERLVSWYELFMFLTVVGGAILWAWQLWRGKKLSWRFLWVLPLGVLVFFYSIHLADCFFYQPRYYLEHPLESLNILQGGYSSHGAAFGGTLFLLLVARPLGMSSLESVDRFMFTSALGAALVRLGNFFNSEIVGRVTDVPWAMRFMRYDAGFTVRHPSQLYEFAIGLFMIALMFVADRRAGGERRPVGLLTGLFFSVYFALRFLVEFTK